MATQSSSPAQRYMAPGVPRSAWMPRAFTEPGSSDSAASRSASTPVTASHWAISTKPPSTVPRRRPIRVASAPTAERRPTKWSGKIEAVPAGSSSFS